MNGVPAASKAETLVVNEIFKSIQGESTWAGLPCVFVRLTGCNLRCVYCDTTYAYAEGTPQTIDAVLEHVRQLDCTLVEITGGEPLLQEGCALLAQRLLDDGHTVLVETSGAQAIDRLPVGAIRIMDIKCPGSDEADKTDWANLECLTPRDEVKFVVADRPDFEWAVAVTRRHHLTDRCNAVLISPVHRALDLSELARWILETHLPLRLQPQIHKYIWPADMRGV